VSGVDKPACVRCNTVGTLDPGARRGLVRLVRKVKHGRQYYVCEHKIGCAQRRRNANAR
jgi:hypothetical protein